MWENEYINFFLSFAKQAPPTDKDIRTNTHDVEPLINNHKHRQTSRKQFNSAQFLLVFFLVFFVFISILIGFVCFFMFFIISLRTVFCTPKFN